MATELEIMMHAKDYLDKLANGINPLTDEALPKTDIVNQVRISRCLFFVSDVLRQVIEKGGLKKTPKAVKVPFVLSAEQLSRFQLFEQPIFISAITERINSLIENEDMRRLSHRSITTFLEREGFLVQYRDSQGKTKREPTDRGIGLGISTEERTSLRGDYKVVLYDKKAQQFILDHMDQIAEINQMTKKQQSYSNPEQTETVDPETGEIIRDDLGGYSLSD